MDEYVFRSITIFPFRIYFGLLRTYIMCQYLSSPVFSMLHFKIWYIYKEEVRTSFVFSDL